MTQADYDFEEVADLAVTETREFLDTQERLIQQEHLIYDAILGWHNIVGHLEERIPNKELHLHALLGKISETLSRVADMLHDDFRGEIRLEKEEHAVLQHLSEDVSSRRWRAVKRDIVEDIRDEKRILRAESSEIKRLHEEFKFLVGELRKSTLKSAIDADVDDVSEKADYEQLESYYLMKIYHGAVAYERILRELLEKEKGLEQGLLDAVIGKGKG